jgi:cell division protein FtsB
MLTIYFTYSTFQGQYGLFNKFKYDAQEQMLLEDLKLMQLKTAKLERKVNRLSNEYLDLELLDQQARKLLGMAKPNEIIIQ